MHLEMPKFTKTEEQLESHFDKWLYVLKNLEDLTKRPSKLQVRVFNKVFDQAEIARYSDAELKPKSVKGLMYLSFIRIHGLPG